MRVIIAGPRDWIDEAVAIKHIESAPFPITLVLSGMATGMDMIGYRWAKAKGLPIEPWPALWTIEGHAAGPKRNERMARAAGALILLWWGDTTGSADMLRRAIKHCLWVHELRVPR